MPTKIDVLDHGYVRLVSYMQPVPESIQQWNPTNPDGGYYVDTVPGRQPGWTGDLEVVRNARVSYDSDWRSEISDDTQSKDARLLSYMYHNHHTSPFEAMVFTFEIKCPIFIARQWHRHRTWSYNEVSARYTELPNDFYVPAVNHIGTQDPKNKQARQIKGGADSDINVIYQADSQDIIRDASEKAHLAYQQLLARKVPREIARSVLPVNTYTRYFGTVDLHNLIHFIRLRADSHAQWEIQEYANALIELIRPVCPIATGFIIDELYGGEDDVG